MSKVCSSFTWLKEKGLVCQSCKLTCHKKCQPRITATCSASASSGHGNAGRSLSPGSVTPKITVVPASSSSSSTLAESSVCGTGYLFGVNLEKLLAGGTARLPPIIERLITTIELVGLYTEGLYRKSGVSSRVAQLKKSLEEEASDCRQGAAGAAVDLQEQPIHVLTAVLKAFLRELPQPLLTYERYVNCTFFSF